MAPASAPAVSVILATYNRRGSATRLLRQLAEQTLPSHRFEVIVVDDGSVEPVTEWLPALSLPFRVTALRQANAGAAAARHRGILEARGELLVVTDDDMQIAPGFLEAHLERHGRGSRRVVVGRIRSSSQLSEMPVFERFHAELLDKWTSRTLRGDSLYTGNVSMRRSDYLDVGGFDTSLERAEDIDLGWRLVQAGVEVEFSEEAYTVHDSDHTDFGVWRRRAVSYGRCWTRISRKYPSLTPADPWALYFGNAMAKRPFASMMLLSPRIGGALSWVAQRSAAALDRLGAGRPALRLTGLLWELEFFRGVRQEAGGLAGTVRSLTGFLGKVDAGGPSLGLGRDAWLLARIWRSLSRAPRLSGRR